MLPRNLYEILGNWNNSPLWRSDKQVHNKIKSAAWRIG